MIFLIQYDRAKGAITSLKRFKDGDLDAANEARLDAEVTLGVQNPNLEIVTLQADSEETLRRTHSRYFRNIQQLKEGLRQG